MTEVKFPLKLVFKLFAFVTQIWVTDADGQEVLYIYQRYFKIKEKIDIYSNSSKENKLYEINADRIIDFSPNFTISSVSGEAIGSIKRYGWKSLLKGYYEISDDLGNLKYKIVEANPLIKFIDEIVGQIPIIGIFTGLFLHPEYAVLDLGLNKEIARIKKRLALSERVFEISLTENNISEPDKTLIANSLIMLALLERRTG